MKPGPTIIGLGEALFDVFPDREVLGGAPLNAAVHAHQLVRGLGGFGLPLSRVGQDELGGRLLEELSARGIPVLGIQIDERKPTGRVLVTFRDGEPDYEIAEDVAWDWLEFDENWQQLADGCHAVCFGTLAQRSPRSRSTIQSFLRHATNAIRMFDVNLRQSYFSAEIARQSVELATVVKLNEAELPRVVRLLGIADENATPEEQAEALRRRFGLEVVVLTRGAEGTLLFSNQGTIAGESIHYPLQAGADSVGAGDACSAGILVGLLLGWPLQDVVGLANAAGAFVASQPGATPELPRSLIDLVNTQRAVR